MCQVRCVWLPQTRVYSVHTPNELYYPESVEQLTLSSLTIVAAAPETASEFPATRKVFRDWEDRVSNCKQAAWTEDNKR